MVSEFGSPASNLFETISISNLSMDDICESEGNGRLSWSAIGAPSGKLIDDLISQCLRDGRPVTEMMLEHERL
jgi:hypothetical protein